MNKQSKKIQVRFFETAEFQITPTETRFERNDCFEADE